MEHIHKPGLVIFNEITILPFDQFMFRQNIVDNNFDKKFFQQSKWRF